MIKVFVGTLESGEVEFSDCKRALAKQEGIDFYHHIISGRSERVAHKELFRHWLAVRHQFDYFLKLDADTVLMKNSAILQMVTLMQSHNATGLQVKILDYFSGRNIPGLNMFNNEVEFQQRSSRLFPDSVDRNHRLVLKGGLVEALEPIAFHGVNPGPRQSFYYGFHRFLKQQKSQLNAVYDLWQVEQDSARRWALIGAMEGSNWMILRRLFSSRLASYCFQRQDHLEVSDQMIDKFARKKLQAAGSDAYS